MPKFEARGTALYIDGKKVMKGWESFTGWYWFATEVDRTQTSVIDGKEYPNDLILFGFVQGFVEEWGYWSQTELDLLTGKVWEINKADLPYAGRRE